jgi:hypothetical protein
MNLVSSSIPRGASFNLGSQSHNSGASAASARLNTRRGTIVLAARATSSRHAAAGQDAAGEHLVNATPGEIDDLEAPAAGLDVLAFARDVLQTGQPRSGGLRTVDC